MHFPTHFAISWLVGHKLSERKDRALVAWAGVLPDFDGIGIVTIFFGRGIGDYAKWHHVAGHGITCAIVAVILALFLAKRKLLVAALVFFAVHLHLLCDLIGSRWKITYFWPFDNKQTYPFSWGWYLDSWQNVVIVVLLLLICLKIALIYKRTFLEALLPQKADALVVETIQRWFAKKVQK